MIKYMRVINGNLKNVIVFEGSHAQLKKIARAIKPKGSLLGGIISFDFGNDNDGFSEYAVTKSQFQKRVIL